jgi:hypothetical protein
MAAFHKESSRRVAKRIFGGRPVPDPVYMAQYRQDQAGLWHVWVSQGPALTDQHP